MDSKADLLPWSEEAENKAMEESIYTATVDSIDGVQSNVTSSLNIHLLLSRIKRLEKKFDNCNCEKEVTNG